jgi:hypothetical protein
MFRKRITVILILSALVRAALAQDQKGWNQCIGREDPIPEVVIKGCSEIIQDTQNAPDIGPTRDLTRRRSWRIW